MRIGAELCRIRGRLEDGPLTRKPVSGLRGRQGQCRAQAADRRRTKRQLAAIEAGELEHDRQAETGTRFGFIKPAATMGDDLLALGRGQPGPGLSGEMKLWSSRGKGRDCGLKSRPGQLLKEPPMSPVDRQKESVGQVVKVQW